MIIKITENNTVVNIREHDFGDDIQDCTQCESDLATCQDEKQVISDNLTACVSDKETIQANLDTCIADKATLEDTITNLNSQIETLTSDLETCTTDKEAIQTSLDTCIAEKADLQTALDAANATIATLNDRLDSVNSRLDTLLGRVIDGDEVAKLDALDSDKLAIKTSIETKTGNTLTDDFSTYPAYVDAIQLDTYVIESWEEQAGRDKFVGIVNIYPNNSYSLKLDIGLSNNGTLNIDWGDGIIEDISSGVIEHVYNYDSLGSKIFSNEKKQAIITIVPTDNSVDRFKYIKAIGVDSFLKTLLRFSDVKIESDNQDLDLDNTFNAQYDLKTFEFIGDCNPLSLSFMFRSCDSLDSVIFKNIKGDNVILDYMFYSCNNMPILFKTQEPVKVYSARSLCYVTGYTRRTSTVDVEFDMQNSNTTYYMFGRCGARMVNIINTQSIKYWDYYMIWAYNMEEIDIDMTSATSAIRAFESLYNLKTINLTLLPVSTDITNCYMLPASEIENLILNQLKDVSENDTNEVLKLTGTVTEDELSQDALDHAVAYGWDLVF